MLTQRYSESQREQTKTYQKEQSEYIQVQFDEIISSVEYRLSQIAWQKLNKVGGRKSTSKEKLKAAIQEENFTSGKNISRICSEIPLKLLTNLPKKSQIVD